MKENNSVKPSKPILRIIDHWGSLGLHQNKNPDTKVYKKTVERIKKVRRGSFDREGFRDRKFTDEEIIRAIDNFSLAATDPSRNPAEGDYKDYLKKLSLQDFFHNEWTKNGNRSLFLYYLENQPKPVEPATPDYYPPVTREIEDSYVREVLGNVNSEPFSNHEKNCFRKGGKMLVDFFKSVEDKCWLSGDQKRYPELLVPYVFHALRKEHNDNLSKVTPGWFSQPSLYSRTVLAYLHQQALITGED
jgi:hypothetical protein